MVLTEDRGFRTTTAGFLVAILLAVILYTSQVSVPAVPFGPVDHVNASLVSGGSTFWFAVGMVSIAVGITLLTVATAGVGSIAVASAIGIAQTTTWGAVVSTSVFGGTVMMAGGYMARENSP